MASLLFLAAIPLAWWSWGPLHNLFEDYQDSSPAVYLAYGLPLLVLALACIAVGLFILRRG
jgi:hypothetical protein